MVENTNLSACSGCSSTGTCTSQAPLEACCTWAAEPCGPLVRATTLHRYSAPAGDTALALSCLASPGSLGTPKMVTLTGYVWLFSSGVDSQGVKVEVYTENNPNTDGSISSSPVGTYTTTAADPADPIDTSWNSRCPSGCSLRQYTIPNVPTETPLVIKTSDATGSGKWATVYEYNVYFSNSSLVPPDSGGAAEATYLATAAESNDLGVVAGTIGLSPNASDGMLVGEVHDCGDVRLSGATVGVTVPPQGSLFYFTSDESFPLPDQQAHVTGALGMFGGINFPARQAVRVTAMGGDPGTAGKFLMLGTYVVQMYPGAMTTISLRGRRPWQP